MMCPAPRSERIRIIRETFSDSRGDFVADTYIRDMAYTMPKGIGAPAPAGRFYRPLMRPLRPRRIKAAGRR